MKKILTLVLTAFAMVSIAALSQANAAQTYKITAKAPYISPSLKPIITEYRSGDYLGAMVDLETLLKREPNNTTAKYYLALCYTQLGYKTEAEELYNEIVDLNENMTLVHYSKRALTCIDNPEGEGCTKKVDYSQTEAKAEADDMTQFINSGQKLHPSVRDRMTKERLERQMQLDQMKQDQNTNSNLQSKAPTNEEIAQALNTLSKIGMNPYNQNYAMVNMVNNPYQYAYLNSNPWSYPAMLNSNPEMARLMMYNQLNQQITQQFAPQSAQNFNTFGL